MISRPDLVALADDALIQLANAGLLKRALRDQADGKSPTLEETAEGVLEARFSDGVVTRLAPGKTPLEADCSCPASGMCRHRIGLVVAYRDAHRSAAVAPKEWDPGALDLAALENALDAEERANVAKLRRGGVHIRLARGATPAAALPMANVRFLAPNDANYARCDCARGGGCAHVVLAVEAFRRANGANEATIGETPRLASSAGLVAACGALIERLLVEGATAGVAAHGPMLDHALREARSCGASWLALTLEALQEQIVAYESRSARYDSAELLSLVVELYARPRAGSASALGFGEPMETAMAKTRLVSLGGRVVRRGSELDTAVMLVDSDTGAPMLMRKTFAPTAIGGRNDASVARRSVLRGVTLDTLARGQVLSSTAKRRADGVVRFSSSARDKTSLMARGPIMSAPGPVFVDALAPLREGIAQRPPQFIRPRSLVLDFHVLWVGDILGHGWEPGEQIWRGAVTLSDGERLILERRWDAGAPQAIGVLSRTFDSGDLRQIAGVLRFVDGNAICDPWSLSSSERFIVPDVEDEKALAQQPVAHRATQSDVLRTTRYFLAGALHAGVGRMAHDFDGEIARMLRELVESGWARTAERLERWRHSPRDAAAFSRVAIFVEALRDL
ncbi:SWIM zinc finger family protein [Methylosinus sporium]|uniref:SWIM zinc finger family protein n=1 Tax=Methylosinus sporium TaxID=428 RepID=UPI00383AEF19